MKPRTKRLLNLLLIVGTLAIVLIIGLRDNDLPQTIRHLTGIRLYCTILCLLCWMLYNFCDAFSVWCFLRRREVDIPILYCYFASIVGAFYCNVTPGATGGQPMQIYYLHKRGAPTGLATSSLIGHFFCYQVALIVLGGLLWATHPHFVAGHVGDWMWAMVALFIYNVLVCGVLITVSIYQPAVHWLLRTVIRIGVKLRLVKHPEETMKKWTETGNAFHRSLVEMFHNPAEMALQLLIAAVQIVTLMSIIWFVYIGMQLPYDRASYPQILTLSSLEYITAANTPLPGASGVHELAFTSYFDEFFREGTFAALLLWRFFTFYITLIIGSIAVIINGLLSGKSLHEVANLEEEIQEEGEKLLAGEEDADP